MSQVERVGNDHRAPARRHRELRAQLGGRELRHRRRPLTAQADQPLSAGDLAVMWSVEGRVQVGPVAGDFQQLRLRQVDVPLDLASLLKGLDGVEILETVEGLECLIQSRAHRNNIRPTSDNFGRECPCTQGRTRCCGA